MVNRVASDKSMPRLVCISELHNPSLNTKCVLGLSGVLAVIVCCLSNHKGHPSILILFLHVKVHTLDNHYIWPYNQTFQSRRERGDQVTIELEREIECSEENTGHAVAGKQSRAQIQHTVCFCK